jgi:hypothetical protein
MIQINTDNYGLVDFSLEDPLELTTNAIAFGGEQIKGWYASNLTEENSAKYQHFTIITDQQFDTMIFGDEYLAFAEMTRNTMTCWIVYKAETKGNMAKPVSHWLCGFLDEPSLIQFKQMIA